MKKPKYYFIIVIFSIFLLLGGVFGIISSFPIFHVWNALKAGGIYVESEKVSVEEVLPSTPAEEAGLLKGDTIISIDGMGVQKAEEVARIASEKAGTLIELTITRNGVPKTATIVPRKNPPEGQGSMGTIVANREFQKQSPFLYIPKIIIQIYSGKEPYLPFVSTLWPKYYRIQLLIQGSASIAVAIGLLKLKKWAFYGYLALLAWGIFTYSLIVKNLLISPKIETTNLISNLYSARGLTPPDTKRSLTLGLTGLIVESLFVVYLIFQRSFFGQKNSK